MGKNVRVGAGVWIALVSLGLCGPPALAQPDSGKEQPKRSAAEPVPIVDAPIIQPAYELTPEQKLGLEDLVKLAPWLVVIGTLVLIAVIISTIVLGPEVVWGPSRKRRSRSLAKKEAREPGRQVINLDPWNLDG